MRRLGWLVAVAALVSAGWLQRTTLIARLPPQWNPWAAYDVNAPIGPATPVQYWRTTSDASLCRDAVRRSGLQISPIADFTNDAGCSVHDAFEVHGDIVPSIAVADGHTTLPRAQNHAQTLTLKFNHAFIASCPVALAMARFDRETLIPAAMQRYGQAVREITHVGTYACRPVLTDRTKPPASVNLSEHAHANAIDVTGFILADGKHITVAHDWTPHGNDTSDAQAATFLRTVHDGACKAFHTTLGPDYNALHQSHFHLDMGKYRICR